MEHQAKRCRQRFAAVWRFSDAEGKGGQRFYLAKYNIPGNALNLYE